MDSNEHCEQPLASQGNLRNDSKISFEREYENSNFTITAKFSRTHWLIFIVNKRTDNKNDVRCSARAFSTENQS